MLHLRHMDILFITEVVDNRDRSIGTSRGVDRPIELIVRPSELDIPLSRPDRQEPGSGGRVFLHLRVVHISDEDIS